MDIIAKLPTICSMIYRNTYKDGKVAKQLDPSKDWSFNFATMLGYDDPQFIELLRMYLTIHRYIQYKIIRGINLKSELLYSAITKVEMFQPTLRILLDLL